MKKIIPHLWFNTEAKDATALYTSLFLQSEITSISTIKDTPSGDCDIVNFKLNNQPFMAISAGPYFQLNPSISFFASFETEEEIENIWNTLIDGGKALMELGEYPWAKKYGWVQDKFGLSWQLSVNEENLEAQKITPAFLFTQAHAGKAKSAIEAYTTIFPNSQTDLLVPYTKEDNDTERFIKYSHFTLDGNAFIAMDSSAEHAFSFNEAVSFIVTCDTQEEIDYYWEKLSSVPEAEQCGWVKDAFGVSWQIVPSQMNAMMKTGTKEQIARVTQSFLKMKKFNIAELEAAYNSN